MTSLVVGLDPGFANLGWAVVELGVGVVGMGVVVTERDGRAKTVAADNVRRGYELAIALSKLFNGHRPNSARERGLGLAALFDPRGVRVVCAESMSAPRNAAAAGKMQIAWGAIIMGTLLRRLPLLHMSPQSIKSSLVGSTDASKKHVERVMQKRWGKGIKKHLAHLPGGMHEHAYDALAALTACLDTDAGKAALA